MKLAPPKKQVQRVIEEIERMGYRGHSRLPGAERTAVCIVGNKVPGGMIYGC